MSLQIEKLKNKEWYTQAAEAVPLFLTIPARSFKNKECGYPDLLLGGEKEYVYFYVDLEEFRKISDRIFIKEKKSPGFALSVYQEFEKARKEFDSFFEKSNLRSKNDKDFLRLINGFEKLVLPPWNKSIFLDVFDPTAKIYLKRFESGLSKNEINKLLSPDRMLFQQREQMSLCNLATRKKQKNFKELLLKHRDQYFFYQNNFSRIFDIGLTHFEKKAKTIKNPSGKLLKIKKELKKRKLEKKLIYQKNKKALQNKWVFDFFSLLSIFREERKAFCQKSNHFLNVTVKEVAKRRKVLEDDLRYLDFYELKDVASGKKVDFRTEEKKKHYLLRFQKHKERPDWILGKEALKIKNTIEKMVKDKYQVLKGMAACEGKVKGKVKVIRQIKDFRKMKKGDILVASNTRPEFLPIMKKAAAIVTDEGGVSCHAAIVSRELNIPCVVGVQTASLVLKDGEEVEVDASKGVIRRIK